MSADNSTPQPDGGDGAVAWTVFDAKHIRFTVYNRELAEAIAERGLLVLPMFGGYEWFDAKADEWKPIDRLPYTWERELGIQWRACTDTRPPAAAAVPEGFVLVPKEATPEMVDAWTVCNGGPADAYQAMLAAAPAAPKGGVCNWTFSDADSSWDSDCGEKWQFTDGGPSENSVRFCHGCGKPIAISTTPRAEQDFPECSGNPASCPENEGYGCCKPNPRAEQGGQEVGNG